MPNTDPLLTSADWSRLQNLFQAANELPQSDRAAFLDKACQGQTRLRGQVESLLRSFDGESVIEPAVRTAVERDAAATGDLIGPYRIIRELGHGGMGVVFLAARADNEFQKLVAIKLLRGGWFSPELCQRFLRERQILAQLDHPNIARMLDGGTVDRAPYVVMEYVDGVPIDVFCRDLQLSVPARLRLFQGLCDAVAYAHRNLIIHRDIKPGNVLVAGGTLKLLDFGIAKLFHDDAQAESLALTRTGVRLMTPEYASPEQVRGDLITTASDVYSLGVLLYQLLAEKLPFNFVSGLFSEIEAAICLTEPAKPSTLARRRELEGDLDNIVLMAMRKEPERRYASADQLSQDIRRYLDGFPVSARQDTWSYRAAKFIRRHTVGVAAAALVSIMILGFGIGMASLAKRVVNERDTARAERSRAEQVSNLLIDTFNLSDPSEHNGAQLTAREILDRAVTRIDKEPLAPETRADVLDTFGVVFENLELYDRARPPLERSRDLRIQLYGLHSAQYGVSLKHLAELADRTGDWSNAINLFRQAIPLLATDPGQVDLRTDALTSLGETLQKKGQMPEAESSVREALAILRTSPKNETNQIASSEDTLAIILMDRDKFAEAEQLLRDALSRWRKSLGDDNLDVADALRALGQARFHVGDYKQALGLFNQALAIKINLLGPDKEAVATIRNDLATAYFAGGDVPAAEAMYEQSIDVYRKTPGRPHLYLPFFMHNLAVTLHNRGNHAKEAAIQKEMEQIAATKSGMTEGTVLSVQNGRSCVLYDRGEYAAAERGFRAEIEKRRAMGGFTPALASALGWLGQVLAAQNHLSDAEQILREAAAMQVKVGGENNVRGATVYARLGRVLLLEGKNREARETLTKAIAIFRATTGPTHPLLARALLDLGELELMENHAPTAVRLFEEALAIRKQVMIPGSWEITVAESSLARARGTQRSKALTDALNRCSSVSYECRLESKREMRKPPRLTTDAHL